MSNISLEEEKDGITIEGNEVGNENEAFKGYRYTWERGKGTEKWIEIKLDRALAYSSFLRTFTEVKLFNLEISTSDHSPLFLEPVRVNADFSVRRFKFENAWLREPMCQQLVKEVWQEHQDKSFQSKLLECLTVLSKWGKEITGCFKSRISQSKKVMKMLKGRRDQNSVQLYQKESENLTEAYCQQEVFWRQRSKQLWLREGDQNSRFFHASAKSRRKVNQIDVLPDRTGCTVGWGSSLEETMVEYFVELFKASNTDWSEVMMLVVRHM
ncbi:hypothetical protein POM88_020940 [Heracleum sosnowskyi]|uniref:Endonuclease/exonuclease/phosphatase n=1 Tax=Heracleum sosnowskyi TaxID=360622 RepID=A0AAD8MNJ0_9APIA|nr:hypothetical protein POM88_020940 [Heracleum sosnowskyi]